MAKKMKIAIEGLNCAHCAGKIDEKIKQLDYLENAELNFINKEISFELKNGYKFDKAFDEIKNIVDSIESGVTLYKEDEIDHDHEHNEEGFSKSVVFGLGFRLGLGMVLFISGLLNKDQPEISFIFFILSYIVFGYDVIFRAIKNILRGNVFDENFLMGIATIGALCIGEYSEAVAVMIFYQVGEFFQDLAVSKSRKSIKDLMDIKSEYANLVIGDDIKKVTPEEVKIGDIVLVKAGEKIPLDGKIIEGSSFIDMSALIGEAEPREVFVGDEALSGAVNLNKVIKIQVEKEYSQSTVAKILELVENAGNRKSKTENFITKFAKIYTPTVVGLAVLIVIVSTIITGSENFSDCLKRGLVFLVSSCPCALIVSIPLGFFSGIGSASKRGILIKGSNFVQALSEINTVVFDKTGTITKGIFEVNQVKLENEKESIKLIYNLEKLSNHPVGNAIIKYCEKNGLNEKFEISNFEEVSGYGLKAEYSNKIILVGNEKLLEKENIKFQKYNGSGTIIYLAYDGNYLGYVVVEDKIKDDSAYAMKFLSSIGIKNKIMLTGDRKATAEDVAKKVGLDNFYAELLPQDKVSKVEEIYSNNQGCKLAFVGDGINDAPVLARADVGVAMGGIGSDAAIEAADVVIMKDELSKLGLAIVIARNTLKLVKQNIIFIITIKVAILLLAAFGYASMWLAVFADVGVALLAILNSMRPKDK